MIKKISKKTQNDKQFQAAKDSFLKNNVYLTFDLDPYSFAINILDVKEIKAFQDIELQTIDAPPFILGVTQLYKKVIPVIDLCFLLNLKKKTMNDSTHQFDTVILVKDFTERVALKILKYPGIIECDPSDLTPRTTDSIPFHEAISASVKINNIIYYILNIKKLLHESLLNYELSAG